MPPVSRRWPWCRTCDADDHLGRAGSDLRRRVCQEREMTDHTLWLAVIAVCVVLMVVFGR